MIFHQLVVCMHFPPVKGNVQEIQTSIFHPQYIDFCGPAHVSPLVFLQPWGSGAEFFMLSHVMYILYLPRIEWKWSYFGRYKICLFPS